MSRSPSICCRYVTVLALLLFLLPVSLTAQSQATTGIIRGVVTDPGGNPAANVEVVVRNTGTNLGRRLTTNDAGAFVAPLLQVGRYEVVARSPGFGAAKEAVVLRLGETVVLQMRLGAVEVAGIEVTAEEAVVDVARAEASTRLPAAATAGLPNNGRNLLNLTLLTPNVAVVQGPDGDEITVAGQRGIHNNMAVDGADFNNPFFGEHRGGQRPPFTFNLDAVQEMVVVSGGANAEFGRSGGGFVNVITKSGTNQFSGSVHYFGKYDQFSAQPRHEVGTTVQTYDPDFTQHQFGFTLGGPIQRDRAFFFLAYDQQAYDETKQVGRPASLGLSAGDGAGLDSLIAWMDTAYGQALRGDFSPISRTNDARAFLAKVDIRLSDRHNLSLKYNYTWSEQNRGTFDVDVWGRSANGLERDFSNAGNLMLASYLSPNVSNELRFQISREDRPRPYPGARSSLLGANPADPPAARPFPDVAMGFTAGFRFGMPFFLPIEYYDSRIQVLDNVSISRGNHLFKFGAEWNRVESVQTFIGFANGRFIFNSVNGFLNYVQSGSGYVECDNQAPRTDGQCPGGNITGPVLLFLQQAGVDRTVRDAGTQSIPQHELAVYIQDTWRPTPRLTLNLGLRWEAQVQPDPITPPSQVFFAPFIGTTRGGFEFPSDGTIPSDKGMWQPRLGFAYDVEGNGRQVLRGSAGLYYARIPGLNLASSRSTNGSVGQTYFRNSALIPILGRPPAFDSLLPSQVSASSVFFPSVFVFDKNFRNPRTFMGTIAYERQVGADLAVSVNYTYSRTDHLTRFIDMNAAVFGSPWSAGLPPGGTNGLSTLTVVQSSAFSRYNGITLGVQRLLNPNFQFQANYTLSWDKSDDDNERDPFTFRYARADSLQAEYNWSDRDQRHRLNAWALVKLPFGLSINNRFSAASAQPVSARCVTGNEDTDTTRAVAPTDRICPDGHILRRNTLRKDNELFSWDVRLSYPIDLGPRGQMEVIVEVFNVLNTDNFKDPAYGGLLFNFDGTIRSGLGDPRQVQAGVRWTF